MLLYSVKPLSGCGDIVEPCLFVPDCLAQEGCQCVSHVLPITRKEGGSAFQVFPSDLSVESDPVEFVPGAFGPVLDCVAVVPLMPC